MKSLREREKESSAKFVEAPWSDRVALLYILRNFLTYQTRLLTFCSSAEKMHALGGRTNPTVTAGYGDEPNYCELI
jgi:hypothetical protein